jgi:hypothetical protein
MELWHKQINPRQLYNAACFAKNFKNGKTENNQNLLLEEHLCKLLDA